MDSAHSEAVPQCTHLAVLDRDFAEWLSMILTFSYRIKDSGCTDTLGQMARAVSFVWNFANETQLSAIRWDKKWPSAFDLHKLTAGSSKELGLHSQSVQAVCEEYATRRKQAKKRKLRWRGKKSLGWIPFKSSGVKVTGDAVTYSGHTFRFWLSRPIKGKIKAGNFAQDAQGHWFVNFNCEVDQPPAAEGTGSIGIDLGLKDFATFSDGEKIEAQQFYRELEPKLAVAQRARKKGRIKAIHAKIANRRKDHLHKLSTSLVRENAAIFVGNVNASSLAKTKMAKSVLDSGWSAFRTMLAYKAIAHRVRFEEIDERFTTQTCSECGSLGGPKGLEGLVIRDWTCAECGAAHDRDVNSAKLILARGHARLAGGIPVL
jgi:putative transposase